MITYPSLLSKNNDVTLFHPGLHLCVMFAILRIRRSPSSRPQVTEKAMEDDAVSARLHVTSFGHGAAMRQTISNECRAAKGSSPLALMSADVERMKIWLKIAFPREAFRVAWQTNKPKPTQPSFQNDVLPVRGDPMTLWSTFCRPVSQIWSTQTRKRSEWFEWMMCLKSNSPKRLSTIVEPTCSAMTLASDVRSLTGVRRCATVWAGIVSVFGACRLVSAVRIDRRNGVYRPCSSLRISLPLVALSPSSQDVSCVLSSDSAPAPLHTPPFAANQFRPATDSMRNMRSNTFFISANI